MEHTLREWTTKDEINFQGKTEADKEKYKQEMQDNCEKDLLSYTNT